MCNPGVRHWIRRCRWSQRHDANDLDRSGDNLLRWRRDRDSTNFRRQHTTQWVPSNWFQSCSASISREVSHECNFFAISDAIEKLDAATPSVKLKKRKFVTRDGGYISPFCGVWKVVGRMVAIYIESWGFHEGSEKLFSCMSVSILPSSLCLENTP